MDRPTAAQLREWATGNNGEVLFDFGAYGYAPPVGAEPDRLERVVERAVGYVEQVTARRLDATLTEPGLVALAQDAVYMRVVQILVGRGTRAAVTDALDQANVQTLRAGDFSVTFRGSGDARKAAQVNPWTELSDTLLALATPERRAELLGELTGQVRAVGLVVEPAFGDGVYGYER